MALVKSKINFKEKFKKKQKERNNWGSNKLIKNKKLLKLYKLLTEKSTCSIKNSPPYTNRKKV